MVNRGGGFLVLAILAGLTPSVQAHLLPCPLRLVRTNIQLAGKVIDHTANHGRDLRIPAPSLCGKRDMYVYLPPGYDPCKRYPLAIYLHGFLCDEVNFIRWVVKPFDDAIVAGKIPPVIIAAPDGSPKGYSHIATPATFFLNSNLGNFEDFLVEDVYRFLMTTYSIRPEPEAHALLGVSMGGAVAFCKVMKHRDKFGIAAAFAPPLNVRWISCRDRYFDPFSPCCWKFREDFSKGHQAIGSLYCGLVRVPLRRLVNPLYGKNNPDTAALISEQNPIELLDRLDIKPGFAEFYVAYGGKDEFNIAAQVESFLYRARERGLEVGVDYRRHGKHSVWTALKMLPAMLDWLSVRLEPFRVQ